MPFTGLTVNVPVGAAYLFISVFDDFYGDNVSPNPAKYGVVVSSTVPLLPTPQWLRDFLASAWSHVAVGDSVSACSGVPSNDSPQLGVISNRLPVLDFFLRRITRPRIDNRRTRWTRRRIRYRRSPFGIRRDHHTRRIIGHNPETPYRRSSKIPFTSRSISDRSGRSVMNVKLIVVFRPPFPPHPSSRLSDFLIVGRLWMKYFSESSSRSCTEKRSFEHRARRRESYSASRGIHVVESGQ